MFGLRAHIESVTGYIVLCVHLRFNMQEGTQGSAECLLHHVLASGPLPTHNQSHLVDRVLGGLSSFDSLRKLSSPVVLCYAADICSHPACILPDQVQGSGSSPASYPANGSRLLFSKMTQEASKGQSRFNLFALVVSALPGTC